LQRNPAFLLPVARSEFFFCGDDQLTQRYIEGLRRAGLPETSEPAQLVT